MPVWGSYNRMTLEELEEELNDIAKQFNLSKRQVKQCIWLDLEEDNAR